MNVMGFVFIRHVLLSLGAYVFGKFRGVNFDLRTYKSSHLKGLFVKGSICIVSKSLQYASFAMIPLTLSSCLYFSSMSWFAALVALMAICETLSCWEVVRILISMIGVVMVTMPQLFSFMNPQAALV